MHVADVEVDAILSYPWLKNQKIGVFPHLDTLAKIHPDQRVLTPRSRRALAEATKEGGGNVFVVLQDVRGVFVQAAEDKIIQMQAKADNPGTPEAWAVGQPSP